MKPVVYVDVVLLINLILNFIILYFSIKFSGKIPILWRIALGSLLGSVYAILIFIPQLSIFYTLFFKVIMAFMIILVSTNVKNINDWLKTVLIFYITGFIFGGCITAIFYLFGKTASSRLIAKNIIVSFDFPYRIFVFAVALSVIAYHFFISYTKSKKMKQSSVIRIEITFQAQKKEVFALVDTGCDLIDPITKDPVIIVEKDALSAILPHGIIKMSDAFYKTMKIDDYQAFLNYKLRLIPFDALMKENGMLLAFKSDKVIICNESNTKIPNCLIGIYNRKFQSQFYHALIGYQMVFEREGEECHATDE